MNRGYPKPRAAWPGLHVGALAMVLAGSSLACDADEQGTGTLKIAAYGEEFIEQGIPAEAVADGWAVTFSAFTVQLSDVELGGHRFADPSPIDLTQASGGEGQLIGQLSVPAETYRQGTFTVRSLHVVGSAKKGGESKTFDWTFDSPVSYGACEHSTRVPDGGEATFQITLHADHLLYDSLAAEEPNLLFQPLAGADANADGAIAREELASKGIGLFDPGNDDKLSSLWLWLEALVTTLGHVDGEGHCHVH